MSGERPEGDALSGADNWPDFPDISTFEEEGFQYGEGALEGFQEFMDSNPNAPSTSFAAHGFGQSASAPTPGAEDTPGVPGQSASAPRASRSRHETRQFRNKMSQRRFRERQKAQAESLEYELANTAAQLDEVNQVKAALETKNKLLERLLQMTKKADLRSCPELPNTEATPLDLYKHRGFKTLTDPVLAINQTMPALRLTVWETGEQFIPVQQIGQLGLREFSQIYTAYTHQMAACLSQLVDEKLTDESNSPNMVRLHELIIECGSLLVITLASNPGGFKDLQNCNFEEGVVCPDAQAPSFYCTVMAAMQYTEEQVQDVLHLRQLFCHRMGQLARERASLIGKMSQCRVDMSHVSDKLSETTRWSEELREVGAQEYRSYMQFASAFIRGVSTSKQYATAQVCAFPWLPAVNKLTEAEAVRRGQAPMQVLMEDTSISDLQKAADWEDVALYLEGITEQRLNIHVPLLQH